MAKDVTIRIVGDSDSAIKALAHVEGQTEKFGGKMKSILGAIGGVALAKGVFEFAGSSVDAFKESEASANRLQDAFAKFPALADTNVASLGKLNTALAQKTKFDDDATASGQAVLAQFGLTGKQITALTPLLQDFAAKTGTDIPTAAEQLGKGLLGSGKALKQVGIDFADAGSVGANFDQIMGGLRSQVGGFAEKEGTTAAGKAEILRNQFGELQEKVGSKLVPVLTELSNKLLTVVNFLGSLSPGVVTAIGVITGLLAVVFLVTKAVQAWTAVQAAFNLILTANPIGLVVVAIAALVAGVIWAYKNVGWFRDAVDVAFSGIGAAAQGLGRVFSGVWNGIVAGFVWVRDSLRSIANWVINNVVNRLIDGVNLLITAQNKINPFGKDMPTIGHIPALAAGGIVTKPTLALIGEAGPEAVVPLSRGGMGMGTAGMTVVINVTQPLGTPAEIAAAVVPALSQFFSRGGAIGNGRGGSLAPG